MTQDITEGWYVNANSPKIIPDLPPKYHAEQAKIRKELAYLKERNRYYRDEIDDLGEFVQTSKREKVVKKRLRLRDEVDMNNRRIKFLEDKLVE